MLLFRWKIYGSTWLEIWEHPLTELLSGMEQFHQHADPGDEQPLVILTMRIVCLP